MARVWVGGASGFLGSHLVAELSSAGHDVVAAASKGGLVAGRSVESCDVRDAAAVARSARGASAAFLTFGKVSRDPKAAGELHELHVLGTRAALQGLRQAGVRRVVVASTSGTIAVGEDPERVYRETDPAPVELISRWPYYRTKLYAEREALAQNEPGKFEVVVTNPSLLLGPGDLRESSTGDVRRFLEREIPALPSGGLAFVDVRDAACALMAALERGRAGERYLVSAKNLTLAAFFARLSRISGVPAPLLRMPRGRALALGAHRALTGALRWIGREPPLDEISVEMAQCYWYCDTAKAERELAFRPRDAGETLRDTVDDLVSRGAAFPRPSDPSGVARSGFGTRLRASPGR
jgi:dihydroflavonol-4-reductase